MKHYSQDYKNFCIGLDYKPFYKICIKYSLPLNITNPAAASVAVKRRQKLCLSNGLCPENMTTTTTNIIIIFCNSKELQSTRKF